MNLNSIKQTHISSQEYFNSHITVFILEKPIVDTVYKSNRMLSCIFSTAVVPGFKPS